MRKFLSAWLIWIILAMFAVAIVVAYVPMTKSAEQAAIADLTALIDAAFAKMDAAGEDVKLVEEASRATAMSKARAVTRFIEHDDALLNTDALQALCAQLGMERVDVADYEGTLVASSDAARVGAMLFTDARYDWMQRAVADPAEEVSQLDAADASLVYACVPRTDTDGAGCVLVACRDEAAAMLVRLASPERVMADMSFIKDAVVIDQSDAPDGAVTDGGVLSVKKTVDGRSVVAMRALSTVYTVRNVVVFVCTIVALIAVAAAILMRIAEAREQAPEAAMRALTAGGEDAYDDDAEPYGDEEAYDEQDYDGETADAPAPLFYDELENLYPDGETADDDEYPYDDDDAEAEQPAPPPRRMRKK